MGHCENFLNDLPDYIDGTLSNSKMKLVCNHLDLHVECKHLFERAKIVKKSLAAMPMITTSDEFEERLKTKIQAEMLNPRSDRIIPLKPLVASLTAAAAIAAFAIVINDQYLSDKAPKMLITPKLTTPPMPMGRQVSSQSGNSLNRMAGGPVTIGVPLDSANSRNEGLTGAPGSSADNVLRNLSRSSQMQNVGKEKEEKDSTRKN